MAKGRSPLQERAVPSRTPKYLILNLKPVLRLGLIDGIKTMDDYIAEQWGEDVKVLRYKSKMDEIMEKLVAASGAPSPSLNTLLGGLGERLKIQ